PVDVAHRPLLVTLDPEELTALTPGDGAVAVRTLRLEDRGRLLLGLTGDARLEGALPDREAEVGALGVPVAEQRGEGLRHPGPRLPGLGLDGLALDRDGAELGGRGGGRDRRGVVHEDQSRGGRVPLGEDAGDRAGPAAGVADPGAALVSEELESQAPGEDPADGVGHDLWLAHLLER